MITHENETLCVSAWAERFGIPATVLFDRLSRQWPMQKALSTPVDSFENNCTNFLEWNGERRSVRHWAKQTGLKHATILSRIKKGWTAERILTTPPLIVRESKPAKKRMITFQGETHHLAEWARRMDIPAGILQERLAENWSIERALTTPKGAARKDSKTDRRVTHNGETKTIGEWSKESGTPVAVIFGRIKQGWPPEKAIFRPVTRNRWLDA